MEMIDFEIYEEASKENKNLAAPIDVIFKKEPQKFFECKFYDIAGINYETPVIAFSDVTEARKVQKERDGYLEEINRDLKISEKLQKRLLW